MCGGGEKKKWQHQQSVWEENADNPHNPQRGVGEMGGISGSLNFFWERLSDRAFWGFTGSAILEVIKPILGEEGL